MGTLVTAIIAMVAIFIVKELNHKFAAKLPMPIPIELITVPRAAPAPSGDTAMGGPVPCRVGRGGMGCRGKCSSRACISSSTSVPV